MGFIAFHRSLPVNHPLMILPPRPVSLFARLRRTVLPALGFRSARAGLPALDLPALPRSRRAPRPYAGLMIETLEARIAPATISINGGAAQSLGASGTYNFAIGAGNLTVNGTSFGAAGTITSVVFSGEPADASNTGNDTINVASLTGLAGDLTLNGLTGNDTITFTGSTTFAANKSLTVDGGTGLDNVIVSPSVALVFSGTGALSFTATGRIGLQNGSSVTAANGNVTLLANSGGASAGDFDGISLGSDGSNNGAIGGATITTSGSGNISLTGSGGDALGANGNIGHYGVHLESPTVKATGTGTVTIMGTGGDGPFTSGGVFIGGAAGAGEVSSATGLTITGTGVGASTGAGGTITGVSIFDQVLVQTTGSAPLTITGTAANGSGGFNDGVIFGVFGTGAVKTASGNLNVTGAAGIAGTNGDTQGIDLTGSLQTTSGTITLTANSMKVGTGANTSVSAGATGTVTAKQLTTGVAINLGSTLDTTASTLELSDAELNKITAGTIVIGDANSGLVTISANLSPTSYKTLDIEHAASFSGTGGFTADITNGSVYERMIVNGALAINTSATLTLNGSYVPTASDTFVIIDNTSGAATTGNFAGKTEGSTVTVAGGTKPITYAGGTGNDVVLGAPPLPNVSLSVSGASVAEDGSGTLTYTFTRSGATTGTLATNFSVTGVASSSSDYTLAAGANTGLSFTTGAGVGTVTFQAGQSTATVVMSPTDDTTVEADEQVTFNVSTGSGYSLGTPANISANITNDDTDVSVTVNPASVSEDSGTSFIYTFTRAGVTASALTTNFTFGGTATFGSIDTTFTSSVALSLNFGPNTGSFQFPAGQSSVTVTVTPIKDNTVEADETLVFTVAAGSGYNVAGTPAQETITNDDSTLTLTSVSPASVTEDAAGNLLYTFTRTGFLGNALAVNYHASGTALGFGAGTIDYTVTGGAAGSSFSGGAAGTGNGVLVFAGGASTATLTVDPTADTTPESNETVIITLDGNATTPAATGGYSLGATITQTGTINDDDASLHATISSGDLTITDISAAGTNDNLTFKLINGGASLEISDPNNVWDGVPATTPASTLSNGGKTLTIPFSAITGKLTVNTFAGTDTVTLDLSGGDFINATGVDFNGGNPAVTPGDKLIIAGGAQGTVTYNYTNATDGNVVMSTIGTVRYTGLEPITNSGTATDVIFNLPGTADTVFLEDNDATPADGMLRLRSSPTTFEQTDFAIPSNSLTINLGAGNDTLTVSAVPQFTGGLTINGGQGDDTINFISAITFAANKNIDVNLQDDDTTPGIDIITMSTAGNLVLSGTGAAIFKASRNIQFAGHLATENGDITLENNQQAVAATGNFQGVNILGTSIVENTGTGHINVLARGGNDAAGQQNGFRTNTGALVRGGTSGDAVTITGTGGATAGNGIFIPNGAVRSLGGNILFTGFGSGTNTGVTIQNSGVVSPAAGGNVVITATAATPTGVVADFQLFTVATNPTGVFTTGNGSITINADSVSIGTNNAFSFLDAGSTGTVTVRQRTNGTNIDLGSTQALAQAGVLDLSDAELDRVIAGTLQIGNANSGAINITNVISPAAYKTLALGKGAAFTTGATTGGFDADVFSGTDYEKITAAGAVSIDPAATLNVTAFGTFVPAVADSFTIIENTTATATTGTFAGRPEGSTVPVGGVNKTLTYAGGAGNNDVVLIGTGVSVALGATTSVVEDSGGNLVYTFTRNGDLTGPLTVNFNVSGGSFFTTGTDSDYTQSGAATFSATAGTVTFQANSATAIVTITPRADTFTEENETVVLTVASGSGYGPLGSPATGTITNDDTTVFINDEPVSVAEDSGGTLTYTFRRAGVVSNQLTVNFTVGGSATFGNLNDYAASSTSAFTFSNTAGTITFAPGSDTATLVLTPVADATVEPDETVQLTVAAGTGYSVDVEGNSLTNTITNDDATVSVAITPPGTVAEDAAAGNFLTYTFTRAGFIANALTVNFTAGGSATKDGDYGVNGASFIGLAGTVTFAPNSTTAIVTVDPTADTTGEQNETVIFTIAAGTGYTPAAGPNNAATGTILDDDTSVSVAASGSPIAENAAGGTVITYTFTRTGENSAPLTINFSAGGSASFANDYAVGGATTFSTSTGLGTVTFAAGSSTASITLTPNNDVLVEGTEDALIFVNTGPGYGVGASPAFGQITDNDTASVAFASFTSSVGEGSFDSIVVTLTTFGNGVEGAGMLEDPFTVFVVDLGGGTATGGGVDYTFNGQSLTFPAGEDGLSIAFFVNTTQDTLSEGSETFRLGLSPNGGVADGIALGEPPSNAVTIDTTPHVATIFDNDIDLNVSITGPSMPAVAGSGPNNLSFTATLTNNGLTTATAINVFANFMTAAGTTYSSFMAQDGTLVGNDWKVDSLAPGATAMITFFLTADPTAANNSQATTEVTINGATQTLTNTEDDMDSASGTIIRQSDLVLTKTDSPDPVGPGAQLTYTIVVANTGPSDNTSATIMDIFPAGFSNVTWTAAVTGSPNPLSGTGNIESTVSIPAGGTATYTVTGTVTAPSNTSITNTASLTSSEDTNIENNADSETTFVGGVDLKLTKAADVAQAAPGTVIKYTLTYRNGGFITANGTSISDLIPANTVFDLANSTAGWQNMLGTALADGAAAGTPASFPIGSLPVSETGAIAILAVRVTATVSAGAGTIDNTAIIGDNGAAGADLVPSDNTAVASSTLVAAPDLVLSVVKNHYTNGGQDLDVSETRNLIARGHEIRYTYTYSNAGNQDATNATLTAEVPTGTSFDSGNSTAGWSQSGPTTYQFFFQSLPAGAQASSVIFAVDINQSRITPLALKKIDSTATLDDGSVNGPDPTPANNTAITSTTLYEGLYAVSPSRQGGAIGKGALPKVRVFDVTTGIEAESITAYERSYRDGVRIAIGDINGDGFDDIVTAAREGTTGKIRVFDGLTHARITVGESQEINAFTGRAARGAYIALGDINGDGRLDIIAGAGLGGGAVKVFSGLTGQQLDSDLTPFGANYRGGVRVASADVSGDGRADLIAGQGSMGSQVKVYFGTFTDGFAPRALNPDPLVFDASNGTAPRLRDGVFLATGDVTGDGIAEIIVGRGKMGNSTGASVGVFKLTAGAPALVPSFTATEIKTYPLVQDKTYKFGARVAATDINFDGIADIVVGAGHLGGSKVQILNGVTGNEISNFLAFPASPKIGVWTAAGAPPIPIKRIIIDA